VHPNVTDRGQRRLSPSRRARRGLRSGALVVTLALGATGCDTHGLTHLGFPDPATVNAKQVLTLWQGSWIAAFAVGAVVWGLIIWSAIFHRKRSEELPTQTRYNLPVEILYTVVPLIMVGVLFYFTARDESNLTSLSEKPDHVVNVVGRQWSWTFNYLDVNAAVAGSPDDLPTLVLPRGQSVRFKLTSPDVIHSFWVPAFLFKMDVIPGRENQFQVTPSKLGTFKGKCAELCGVDHSRMLFTVKVVSPQQYRQYLQRLKAKGPVVTAADAPAVSTGSAQ